MNKIKAMLSAKRGQNTVEYLLMLTVIVGFALIIGALFKNKIPLIANQVMGVISKAVGSLGS